MASPFENLPARILQTIAFYFFASSESKLGPPRILQLLLLSRPIYNALRFCITPGLYGALFAVYFDHESDVDCKRSGLWYFTDSCLAAELVHRCRVLRRVRLRQFSKEHIRTDLWTIYLMILESNKQNEAQLTAVGISEYILEFTRRHIGEETRRYGWPLMTEVNSLALWLICLTVSPREYLLYIYVVELDFTSRTDVIAEESAGGQDTLYDLFRPFALSASVNDPYPITQT
jgi:hypothetical protein